VLVIFFLWRDGGESDRIGRLLPTLTWSFEQRNTSLWDQGGGFHITGHSNGTSLVILLQQFTNCLKTSDHRVHIVRANLLWTGVIFSGDVDADIRFGYGMFQRNPGPTTSPIWGGCSPNG
jgi:hypothetical protein